MLQFVKLLKKRNIKASEIKNILKKYPQVLINVKVKEKKPFEEMVNVKKKIDEINLRLEGVGRSLIRYSGTENVCRIMIEGKDKKLINKMAREIALELKKEVGL